MAELRPPLLEVRHLRVVQAIHDAGSVSLAARRLNLTQPAVSHTLRDLEERLGVRLFERGRRRTRATPEGLRLVETAGQVLEELRRAERELAEHRAGRRGLVRLATGCYTCYHWLPRLLKAFGESYPGVEIQIRPEATGEPISALLEDRLDLAIVTGRVSHGRLVAEPLFEDELVAIMPRGHPLARRRYLKAADFASDALIIHSHPETTLVLQRVLRPAGVAPRRLLQLSLTEAVVESVRAGLGISVLARWAVIPELAAGSLAAVRVSRAGLKRRWSAAMLAERRRHPPLAELVRLLKRESSEAASCCGLPLPA